MKIWRYILILICVLWICPLHSQEEAVISEASPGVDRTSFEQIKKQIDLTKTRKALRPKERKPKEIKEPEDKRTNPFAGLGTLQNLGIFQWISYILIIGLVILLVYMIFSSIEIEKKFELSTDNIDLDNLDDINSIDTDALLEKALANQDYRAAVRIKFLAALKDLSHKEKIKWRKEKTNRDYSRELQTEPYGSSFQELAYIFDYVWYGKQQLALEQYDRIDNQFISFSKMANG